MRRAVITGLGAVTPVGNDVPTTWSNFVAGKSGVDFIRAFDADSFPVSIAAEVKDFDPTLAMAAKEARKVNRDVHFGVTAAVEALKDASFEVTDPTRTGVILGSAAGGLPRVIEEQHVLEERGPGRVSPHWLPNMLIDTTTSHIATMFGARGINHCIVSACASGTHSIGEAAEVIKRDEADVIIAGGTESSMVPVILAGFCAMRALVDERRGSDPRLAAVQRRPGRLRDGGGCGDPAGRGAGARAGPRRPHLLRGDRRRGVERRVPHRHPAPGLDRRDRHDALGNPAGRHRAHRHRLHQRARHVDAVQRPGRDQGDQGVFEEHAYKLAVSSNKSMIGHLFGAAGAVEGLATALTLYHGVIPPTINYRNPDPECDLDYVPNEAREAEVRIALSNSMGLGGHNGCVILKRFED